MENGEAVTHDDFYYVGYSCTHPTSADPSNANPVFSGQDVMMTSAGAAHITFPLPDAACAMRCLASAPYPRVKEVFRWFFRLLQPMIHVIKKQNTYDFESKHLEKNKTSGTYLSNRGSII